MNKRVGGAVGAGARLASGDGQHDENGAVRHPGDRAASAERPRRLRFGSVAIVGTVIIGFLIAALTAVILGALLRIVTLAEKAENQVVPLVIQQHSHAVMASDLARVAEVILGARTREERVLALRDAEAIAHRFASVADTSVLARLDSALHAVRRSAYRADVLDALDSAARGHLRRVEALVPEFTGTVGRETGRTVAQMGVYAMQHGLEQALQAETASALEADREKFKVTTASLQRRLADGPLDLGADQPLTLEVFNQVGVIFDLRREYLLVQAQVKAETATARQLLVDLSDSLTADAAAMASLSASEIVSYGRNGIAVGAIALAIGLAVLTAAAWFLSRHVVTPVLRAHAALEAVQRGERPPVLPPAKLEEFDAVGQSVDRLYEVLTELQEKEKQALRSRQQLQFIFDVAPIPFIMTGVENSIVMDVNKALCALFKADAQALLGRPATDFWVQPQRMDEMLAFLHREARVDNFEAHLMTATGREFWAVLSSRIIDLDSGPVMLIGLYDITERKAYEARLHSLVTELESSNSELEQFAYVTSHDLQEPLRMVSSYLQLLERRYGKDLSGEAQEFIGFAVDGARRMQRLIIDLLDYSRVGRDSLTDQVEMDVVVDEALKIVKPSADECQARIEVIGDLPVVDGVRADLLRMFVNLVGNAIKYRAPDRALKITISAIRDGAMWRFAVADNGIGIDSEYAERVFLIFQRLHGQEAYSGTGIGLAICRKIADRHGGHIWLDSAAGSEGEGRGCTFYFTLPCHAA